MIPRDVKAPTIPVPFHKLLKVVAIVDATDAQTKQLLDHIAAENFEIEVSDSFDRDVSEDASVGAYIALVDGDRLEQARKLARCRSRDRLPDAAVGAGRFASHFRPRGPGRYRRSRRLHLSRAADSRLLRQAGGRQRRQIRPDLLPPFFGGLMAYDGEAKIAFDCPGHQGGQFYRKSPAGQLFFKHFGESIFRNDLCNADVDLGDLLIHEGPAAEAQRHAAKCWR